MIIYKYLPHMIPRFYFNVDTNEMAQPCLDACYYPFLVKTKAWSYENEVRLVFPCDNSYIVNYDNFYFYSNVKVKSIYLGCNISDDDKKIIEEKCEMLGIPVHHLSTMKGNNKLIIKD